MNISSLSVKRPVTTVMAVLAVIVIGIVSLTNLSIDLYPDIEIPVAIVTTEYANVSPEEIERLITRPIEEAVGTVSNIDTIQSITTEGSSIIIVQFNYGTDMDFATLDMREKVDLVKGYLPDGASDPMVMQFDINSSPIMYVTLSGDDLVSLQTYADDVIKPGLERIEGVASVSVSGGYDNYISIKLYNEKMNGYGISIDSIASTLAAQNLNLPAGTVQKGDLDLVVRTVGEFESIEDIENLQLILSSGSTIKLSDIADVSLATEDLTTISKINGVEAVSLAIQKQSGTNTVEVASALKEVIEEYNEDTDYSIDIVVDQSDYINEAVSQMGIFGLTGALLAVLVLFIFLRNINSTVIIGVSIPISVIATFVLIYFADITLNMMTLGGIALGVGMLVDNSVVVLENIYRFRQEGYSKVEAAVKGAKEVAMSVTASTLTTIAVFLPMVFTDGITSIMFKELALTVTFSLVSSLVVSLTLIPMMCSVMLKVDQMQGKHHETRFKLIGFFLDKTDKVYGSIESGYKNLLDWALKHRKLVALSAIIVLAVGIGSVAFIGAEYMPSTDEGMFTISVELESGAKASDTSVVIDEIVEKISDVEEIDYLFSNTDSGSVYGDAQNTGTIDGVLVDMSERDKSVTEVVSIIEEKMGAIPGVKTSVSVQSSMAMATGSSEISISLKGDDYDVLEELSEELQTIMEEVEGTKNISTSLSDAIPQVEIKLKSERASRYGLTTYQVANEVKAVIDGRTATTYKLDGNEINVVIEGDDLYSESMSNLEQISIQTPTGAVIPLELVADVYVDLGPTEIDRVDQSRVVTVYCDTDGRDLASVTSDIEEGIDEKLELPNGYLLEMGGQNQEMVEAFGDLGLALLLAVLLIYMVLASQFESLMMPFIIMFTAPLAFAGGILGLFITGRTINVVSIIGFIMLSGIVVNNAIVLIDYINTRRGFGEERNEAIRNAGPIRLRPIMMTTLTTILGLIPMALGIGEGAEITAPMATVVIFGLLLGTLLTLVFIPVVYSVFDDMVNKRNQRKKKKEDARVASA